jgi:hypothetical protein
VAKPPPKRDCLRHWKRRPWSLLADKLRPLWQINSVHSNDSTSPDSRLLTRVRRLYPNLPATTRAWPLYLASVWRNMTQSRWLWRCSQAHCAFNVEALHVHCNEELSCLGTTSTIYFNNIIQSMCKIITNISVHRQTYIFFLRTACLIMHYSGYGLADGSPGCSASYRYGRSSITHFSFIHSLDAWQLALRHGKLFIIRLFERSPVYTQGQVSDRHAYVWTADAASLERSRR